MLVIEQVIKKYKFNHMQTKALQTYILQSIESLSFIYDEDSRELYGAKHLLEAINNQLEKSLKEQENKMIKKLKNK